MLYRDGSWEHEEFVAFLRRREGEIIEDAFGELQSAPAISTEAPAPDATYRLLVSLTRAMAAGRRGQESAPLISYVQEHVGRTRDDLLELLRLLRALDAVQNAIMTAASRDLAPQFIANVVDAASSLTAAAKHAIARVHLEFASVSHAAPSPLDHEVIRRDHP